MIDSVEGKDVSKQLESPSLLGENDPLIHLGTIAEGGITGRVEMVLYSPIKYSLPQGLGQRLDNRKDVLKVYPPMPGQWVRVPKPGDILAVKIAHDRVMAQNQFYQADSEISVLQTLNPLFTTDVARPPILYGFGIAKSKDTPTLLPYSIQEYVDDSQFNLLANYIKAKGGRLPVKEATNIAIKLLWILRKAHRAGILHNDLVEDSVEKNTFWNPRQGHLRLVDWANSTNHQVALDPEKRLSYGFDREGVGSLLFQIITGDRLSTAKQAGGGSLVPDRYWQAMPKDIRKVVERSCYLSQESYDPFNVQGTEEMYQDLIGAYKPLI